jgi:RNase P subunit RPR2
VARATKSLMQTSDEEKTKHFSSWMFFDGPRDHVHTKDYVNEIHGAENIQHLSELFPQYSKGLIIESLQVNHGDINAASNWLVNRDHQSHETPFHSPPNAARFACGNCSTILSIDIPSPIPDQLKSICPTCGLENIIPNESFSNPTRQGNPKPHYSSWMFHNENNNLSNSYSHKAEINRDDVNKVLELFPECNVLQVEEALRVAHGDVDLACNWILAHNEYPESSGPSVTYYHPPVPVACVINDRTTLIHPSTLRVSCGNCSHIMTVDLPTTPIQPGSQLSGQCPQCGMTNIIPLRKMSRAVIF